MTPNHWNYPGDFSVCVCHSGCVVVAHYLVCVYVQFCAVAWRCLCFNKTLRSLLDMLWQCMKLQQVIVLILIISGELWYHCVLRSFHEESCWCCIKGACYTCVFENSISLLRVQSGWSLDLHHEDLLSLFELEWLFLIMFIMLLAWFSFEHFDRKKYKNVTATAPSAEDDHVVIWKLILSTAILTHIINLAIPCGGTPLVAIIAWVKVAH